MGNYSFFIAKINLLDARYCDSCPCFYMTEGMYSDCCQLDIVVRDVKRDTRARLLRPDWCPLLKVTTNEKAMTKERERNQR